MKIKNLLIISAAFLTVACGAPTGKNSKKFTLTEKITPSQAVEFDIAKTIIVHEPGNEILPAMYHPNAALFDVYFNIHESKKEHQGYVAALEDFGARVLQITDILMYDCDNKDGKALEELRNFASKILTYDTSELSAESQIEQEKYKINALQDLSAEELVRIIIDQPTVKLAETAINTGITATYVTNPLMNLFYTRDQMITTARGIIISKMNSPQRQNECEVMKFALKKLGIKPIYEVRGVDAFMEGGDVVMYPDISFIGCGLRTTQSAIDQLLAGDYFGTDKVVVVKDRWFTQAEMHLDTFFNIIDKDLATISAARLEAKDGNEQYVTVDIYEKQNGEYVRTALDRPFVDYLQNDLQMTLIPITLSDQKRLAGNYLTVAPREIMAVGNQTDEYKKLLEDNGVKVHWIELENLIHGYGAAHCMTQVIERKAFKK